MVVKVFDIGTPWGNFDVLSFGITRQNEATVIQAVIADLEAGKKIRGINA